MRRISQEQIDDADLYARAIVSLLPQKIDMNGIDRFIYRETRSRNERNANYTGDNAAEPQGGTTL